MSADRRSVATDALETLGTIISENEKRDAIHLAVEPSIAAHDLMPGEDVGFVEGGVGQCDDPVGIVDPFLKDMVKKGQRFWLIVYPRQISSLRHVWEHPKFPPSGETTLVEQTPDRARNSSADYITRSQLWVENYAEEIGLSYDDLMIGARNFLVYGAYLNMGDLLEGVNLNEEFWEHYERITGAYVPENNRHSFFACSC